jgi:hypothetical protein
VYPPTPEKKTHIPVNIMAEMVIRVVIASSADATFFHKPQNTQTMSITIGSEMVKRSQPTQKKMNGIRR